MVSEDVLGLVRKQMSTVRTPAHYDRVYKDECQFSFDTPLSTLGLYINLNSWQAFGHEYVEIDSKRSGQLMYLHELWHKVCIVSCCDMQHQGNGLPVSTLGNLRMLAFLLIPGASLS